jgi:hypothetical protein
MNVDENERAFFVLFCFVVCFYFCFFPFSESKWLVSAFPIVLTLG